MPSLSVIMITLNEETNLRRALASVKFADEIVINDSGSTDATLAIAREFNCRIINSQFSSFGAAKQLALDAATGDWVFSLDADEEVDAELGKTIQAAIGTPSADAYEICRKSQFLGCWILHSGWYPDYLPRLFRRGSANFTSDAVHERIVIKGTLGRLKGHLLHYTDPDLDHYLRKLNRYTTLSADLLHRQGRRASVWQLLVKPPATFVRTYLLKQGFRDGVPGLILALMSGFHTLCKYTKLWERQRS